MLSSCARCRVDHCDPHRGAKLELANVGSWIQVAKCRSVLCWEEVSGTATYTTNLHGRLLGAPMRVLCTGIAIRIRPIYQARHQVRQSIPFHSCCYLSARPSDRSLASLLLLRCHRNQVSTTILPPARFSSIQRCASTMSSSLNTFPIWIFILPASICARRSLSGVSWNSSGPPLYVVLRWLLVIGRG